MIKIFKTEEEWLKFKDTTIGGTAISSILGVNRYQSALQLYRKMKGLDPEIETNDLMLTGLCLEQGLINRFIIDNGGKEKYPKDKGIIPMFVHPEYDFIASSPDSYIEGVDDYGDVLAEVKTTLMYISSYNDLPPQYLTQLNYNIGLAKLNGLNIDTGMFIVLSAGRYYQFEYNFNEDVFNAQIRAAITFKEMLDNDIPPSPKSHADFNFIESIKDTAMYASDEIVNYLQKLKENKAETERLEKEKKFITLNIKKYLSNNEYLLMEGMDDDIKLASFVKSTRKAVDLKKLKKEKPDIYDEYMTEKYLRILRINYRNI